MKRIFTAAALLAAALAPTLLAALLGSGATTANAQGAAVPSRIIAPADTSWGGCGSSCHPMP